MKIFRVVLVLAVIWVIIAAVAADPRVEIKNNYGTNVVVWVSADATNTQYWVLTSNDYTVISTNWYEWRRFYPGTNNAVPVFDPAYSTNMASGKPMRYFKIGDPLP